MKTFLDEFNKIKEKIVNKECFALSRANDGEMKILFDEYIDLRKKCNGEFIYNPKENSHHFFREKLLESIQYKDDSYIVGIGCPCCLGMNNYLKLKQITTQDEEHLTFGNVFVNSNYPRFINEIIPLFSNYNVIMIINNNAITFDLSFKKNIVKIFDVGTNAWMNDYELVNKMKLYISENNIENHMFLFAAGPFSNILIHECHKISKNNTYLDIGSTLDDMMSLGATRGYLRGADTLNKICVW